MPLVSNAQDRPPIARPAKEPIFCNLAPFLVIPPAQIGILKTLTTINARPVWTNVRLASMQPSARLAIWPDPAQRSSLKTTTAFPIAGLGFGKTLPMPQTTNAKVAMLPVPNVEVLL